MSGPPRAAAQSGSQQPVLGTDIPPRTRSEKQGKRLKLFLNAQDVWVSPWWQSKARPWVSWARPPQYTKITCLFLLVCYFYTGSSGYPCRFADAGPSEGTGGGRVHEPQRALIRLPLSSPAILPQCRGLPYEVGRSPCTAGSIRNTVSHCPPCQLCRAPGERCPPPRPIMASASTLPLEGKTSPELLLPEKTLLICNCLEESPCPGFSSQRAHHFQWGRNNSFIHTSSIYQLTIADNDSMMPTLAAPTPLFKGRTNVQLSLLQSECWFTVHSWSNLLKLFWGWLLFINTGFGDTSPAEQMQTSVRAANNQVLLVKGTWERNAGGVGQRQRKLLASKDCSTWHQYWGKTDRVE